MTPTHVTLPIHVLQALMKQPALGEQWRRRAAREYINREVKQLFGLPWTPLEEEDETRNPR